MRRITSMQMLDKRKQSFMIELEGLPWREIDVEVIVKMKLSVGQSITPEQQSQIDRENEYVLARRRAVNYCVQLPRTRRDIERLLGRKKVKQEVIERVIKELIRQHLLRGREAAQREVRKAERSRLGPLRTEAELHSRGVEEEVIAEELTSIRDPEWQKREVMELARKRLSRPTKDDRKTQKRKTAEYLLRRGFEMDVVMEALEELEKSQDT